MTDIRIPKECNQEYLSPIELDEGLSFETAQKCRDALETANPSKSFVITSHSCPCGATTMYTIREGLTEGCKEGEKIDFDSWDSDENEFHANECARQLNRIAQNKNNNVQCVARNIGGTFVDNWEVTCQSK
jgi:hypothetical protein